MECHESIISDTVGLSNVRLVCPFARYTHVVIRMGLICGRIVRHCSMRVQCDV